MKLSRSIVTVLALFGYREYAYAATAPAERHDPHVITWSFVTKELEDIPITSENLPDIIGVPGAAENAALRQREQAQVVSGIMVLYAGRITVSDLHGQVMLPLVGPTDELTLIVTERIKPRILHGNTVETWTLDARYPAEWFSLKRIPAGKGFMWSIRREVIADTHQEVPYTAIVICVDPEAIEIPVGTWPTAGGINLIVPNIYMTGVRAQTPSSLNTIAVNRFFRPTHRWFASAPARYGVIPT